MVKVVSNEKAVVAQIEKQVLRKAAEIGVEFERILQEEFRGQKSGVTYGSAATKAAGKTARARRGRRVHKASAPGEAPAIETGALRKGITRTVTRLGPMRYAIRIGVSIQSGRGGPAGNSQRSIAHMLEFGTSRMKERPGWRIALEKFKRGYRALTKR